jgi:hypothetical protein
MARSDYRHGLEEYAGRNVLVIEDLNLGKMSVTNDIESVIEEIAQREMLNPVEYMIVYRDSKGVWDAYEFSTKEFIVLVQSNWYAAVRSYIDKQVHNN